MHDGGGGTFYGQSIFMNINDSVLLLMLLFAPDFRGPTTTVDYHVSGAPKWIPRKCHMVGILPFSRVYGAEILDANYEFGG